MKSPLPVTQMELTRQERLDVELKRLGLTYKGLGAMLGISGVAAARRLRGETLPPHYHEKWATVLPEHLLPPPVFQRPGPKPKHPVNEADRPDAEAA